MNGMLWYDNDPKTSLADKIINAARYYFKKYGVIPNYCEVNPATFEEGTKVDKVKIATSKIQVNHIWIGVK